MPHGAPGRGWHCPASAEAETVGGLFCDVGGEGGGSVGLGFGVGPGPGVGPGVGPGFGVGV